MIVTLTGFMGCGKTSCAASLAKKLEWEFVDLDAYIEHKTGRKIPDIISESEEYFRALEIEAVTDIVSMHRLTGENVIIALGGGTFSLEPARVQLLEHSSCVWLSAKPDTIRQRISSDISKRPLFDGNNLEEMLQERSKYYSQSPLKIETDGLSPAQVADKIAESLCPNL